MLVLGHESIHYVFAKIFWKEITEIKIGSDVLSIKIGKLSISPILGNSYIIINEKQLSGSHKYQIVLFFMMPLVFNLVANIMFIFMLHKLFILFSMIFNTTIIIINCLPIMGSDVAKTLKYVSRKRQ